jgi:hypothetical protein
MIVARLTEDQQQLLCRIVRAEFDRTKDTDELVKLTSLQLAIGCEEEYIQMLKDELIPNEGR